MVIKTAHLSFFGVATALSVLSYLALQTSVVNTVQPDYATNAIITRKEKYSPKTSVSQCKNVTQDLDPFRRSQSGEDKVLLNWFKGLCGGSYIEMGAVNGIKFSNSHVFHKALGWKGLMVEASPSNYEGLVVNRPNDTNVNAAVCREEKDLHWVGVGRPALGGFREFAPAKHQEKWWKNMDPKDDRIVKCRPLNHILSEHYGERAYFDFFSLDVEGAEYEVLASVDYERYQFGVILIECDGKNQRKDFALRAILVKNGYEYVGLEERSCWFVNRDFNEIYEHFLYSD